MVIMCAGISLFLVTSLVGGIARAGRKALNKFPLGCTIFSGKHKSDLDISHNRDTLISLAHAKPSFGAGSLVHQALVLGSDENHKFSSDDRYSPPPSR